jgi:hypothetical protein
VSRPRLCEFWLATRRQCELPACGLYKWHSQTFLDGSHSFLTGFGPGPATALCPDHLRRLVKAAGPPNRQTGPAEEQW